MAKALKQPKVRLAMAITQMVIALILIAVGGASLGIYTCGSPDPTTGTCPSTDVGAAFLFGCVTDASGVLGIILGIIGLVSPILAIVNFKNMRPPFLAANLTCDILTSAFALVVGITVLELNFSAEASAASGTTCFYDGTGLLVFSVSSIIDVLSAFALISAVVNLAALSLDSYEMHMLRQDDAFYCCTPDE